MKTCISSGCRESIYVHTSRLPHCCIWEANLVFIFFNEVHVSKSNERELPAASAMTVPAGIVVGDVVGFDGEGASCSLSFGVVMEAT